MPRFVRTSEQNKLIRKALKTAFPGFKFDSIRASHGGGAVQVEWTDGPTKAEVDAVVSAFKGGYYDAVEDYHGVNRSLLNGEEVYFEGESIFTKRDLSQDFISATLYRITKLDISEQVRLRNETDRMDHDDDSDRGLATRVARITSRVVARPVADLPTIVR